MRLTQKIKSAINILKEAESESEKCEHNYINVNRTKYFVFKNNLYKSQKYNKPVGTIKNGRIVLKGHKSIEQLKSVQKSIRKVKSKKLKVNTMSKDDFSLPDSPMPETSESFEPEKSESFEPEKSESFEPKTSESFEPTTMSEPETSESFEPTTMSEPETSETFGPITMSEPIEKLESNNSSNGVNKSKNVLNKSKNGLSNSTNGLSKTSNGINKSNPIS